MKYCIKAVLCFLGTALLCIGCNDREKQSLSLTPVESVGEEIVSETVEVEDSDTSLNAKEISSTDSSTTSEQGVTDTTVKIGVYTCGAVNIPGVYYFPQGTRVHEALQAAGGMTDDAAAEYLNQAEVMYDGQRLYVPTTVEVEEGLVPKESPSNTAVAGDTGIGNTGGDTGAVHGDTSGDGQSTAPVNINTATIEQLKTLPGVGDAKAKSIIAYRESVGSYQRKEDIMLVEGIKEGMYAKLKDYIVVQ